VSHTYEYWYDFLKGQQSERLTYNTYARVVDGTDDGDNKPVIAIKLHDTDIIEYWPCGKIVINLNNWASRVTADRIDNYSSFQIYAVKGVWWIRGSYDGLAIQSHMLSYEAVDYGTQWGYDSAVFLPDKRRAITDIAGKPLLKHAKMIAILDKQKLKALAARRKIAKDRKKMKAQLKHIYKLAPELIPEVTGYASKGDLHEKIECLKIVAEDRAQTNDILSARLNAKKDELDVERYICKQRTAKLREYQIRLIDAKVFDYLPESDVRERVVTVEGVNND